MTDQQSSELAKPGVDSFDDPTPLVAPQCSAIRIAPLLAILPVRAINSMPPLLACMQSGVWLVVPGFTAPVHGY